MRGLAVGMAAKRFKQKHMQTGGLRASAGRFMLRTMGASLMGKGEAASALTRQRLFPLGRAPFAAHVFAVVHEEHGDEQPE